MGEGAYVDLLMHEWGLAKQPQRIQEWVRRILEELETEALLILRREPRLEVQFRPEAGHSVWAYFPIYRRRLIAQHCKPKPSTQILLLFGVKRFEQEDPKFSDECLRDHLGHTLLYLRSPKAQNECADAMREWRRSARARAKRKG